MKVLLSYSPKKHSNPIGEGRIIPNKTSIHVHMGGPPSVDTCKARCEYCFLPKIYNYPKEKHSYRNIDKKIQEEKQIIDDLRFHGYDVTPVVPDTFSWNCKYLESGLLDGNKLWDKVDDVHYGVAWTSGLPLVLGDHEKLLDTAKQHDIDVIALTSHGIDDHDAPIRGIVQPSVVRKVVHMIHEYNKERKDKYKVSLTFTFGKHNIESVEKYIAYALFLGVDFVRFNRMIDFTPEREVFHLMMDREDNYTFFETLKKVRTMKNEYFINRYKNDLKHIQFDKNINTKDIRIMVSSDFGFEGEEVLNEKKPINRCPGGVNLFGVFDKYVYACCELFNMPIGKVILRNTKQNEKKELDSKEKIFDIEIKPKYLKRISKIMCSEKYNGCIGHTLIFNKIDLFE